jgi:hypothetical protein
MSVCVRENGLYGWAAPIVLPLGDAEFGLAKVGTAFLGMGRSDKFVDAEFTGTADLAEFLTESNRASARELGLATAFWGTG